MKLSDRLAAVCSTSGSVLGHVLERDAAFRARLKLLISDRPCGAESVAARFNIRCVRLEGLGNSAFSERLMNLLVADSIDYAFLFFSRMLTGEILEVFSARLVNFHPSLLPAFPGLKGFDEGWCSNALLLGSSVHFVDAGIDTGPLLQQTFLAVNRSVQSKSTVRHGIFLQQAASLCQVSDWLANGRLTFEADRRPVIVGADYSGSDAFVPGLELPMAKSIVAGTDCP